jgi:hypothetical protein
VSDPDLWDQVLAGEVHASLAGAGQSGEPDSTEEQEEGAEIGALPAGAGAPSEVGVEPDGGPEAVGCGHDPEAGEAVEAFEDVAEVADEPQPAGAEGGHREAQEDPDPAQHRDGELTESSEGAEQAPVGVAGPFVPFRLGNWSDISALTDEQLEECFALNPPFWLQVGQELQPTTENVAALGSAFVGRRNPVPVRRPGRQWQAEHRALTLDDFKKHLSGEHLLGAYLLDEAGTTGVAVCDIDAEGLLKEGLLAGRYYALLDLAWWARVVGAALSVAMGSGVHVTLTGGKGAHVVCVLPERAPAAIIRRQLHWMCVQLGLKRSGLQWGHSSGDFFVECFPKQDEAGKGLGNLIRLPNGRDPGTGRKCWVVNDKPDAVIEDRAVQPMYRVDPVGDNEVLRREIQDAIEESPTLLHWMDMVLGSKYEASFQRRCEELTRTGGTQMRNAVGQAIHMACVWDPALASGLLSELEMVAQEADKK